MDKVVTNKSELGDGQCVQSSTIILFLSKNKIIVQSASTFHKS